MYYQPLYKSRGLRLTVVIKSVVCVCVPLFLLSVALFFLSFLFINFGPSLPPSIPSLFFLFSVYHVFLTSMYVLCVCLFASSFLSLSSLSSLPLNLEQSPLINYNVKLTKKIFSLFLLLFLSSSIRSSLPSFIFFPSFFF